MVAVPIGPVLGEQAEESIPSDAGFSRYCMVRVAAATPEPAAPWEEGPGEGAVVAHTNLNEALAMHVDRELGRWVQSRGRVQE